MVENTKRIQINCKRAGPFLSLSSGQDEKPSYVIYITSETRLSYILNGYGAKCTDIQ